MRRSKLHRHAAAAAATSVLFVFVACSSDNSSPNNPSDAGSDRNVADTSSDINNNTDSPGPTDAGNDSATCANPGGPTPGAADTHCTDTDGGKIVQSTDPASCHPDGGDDAGDQGCPYGDTMYGQESDDDDCKYHVKWSSDPICQGAAGTKFTVVATTRTDNKAATGAAIIAEVFTTSPADADCDNQSTHPGPNSGVKLTEGPPGTYVGNIQFDQAGQWTVRFHLHEDCADLLPDSPHGHAAYHITVK
jgi:hypothetical protein